MSRILVTGATGFVGRSLCADLLRNGHVVKAALRRDEDNARLSLEGVETNVVGTIDATSDWHNALVGNEAVVHLVARVHVMHDAATDPLAEFRTVNVEGTLNLAGQAAKAGVRRFVYLSSIKVNGEQTLSGQSFTEQDAPAPIDPYAISKYEAEEGLFEIARQTGMEVVVIRPPMVYGKEVKANFLNLIHWVYKGVPLPFGSINNRRSLVALDNLNDFILSCLVSSVAANQTFMVSDGEDISTTELLRRMALALNVPSRLLPVPQKLLEASFRLVGKSDLGQRLCGSLQVDISKANTMLGWKPPITVNEGLRRAAEHFLQSQG